MVLFNNFMSLKSDSESMYGKSATTVCASTLMHILARKFSISISDQKRSFGVELVPSNPCAYRFGTGVFSNPCVARWCYWLYMQTIMVHAVMSLPTGLSHTLLKTFCDRINIIIRMQVCLIYLCNHGSRCSKSGSHDTLVRSFTAKTNRKFIPMQCFSHFRQPWNIAIHIHQSPH